jgi:hypothetical protein
MSTDKKPTLLGAVLPPVLATGAGALVGGVAGGVATRAMLRSPGVRQRLSRMTPEQRRKLVQTVEMLGGPVIGTAGAVGSLATRDYLEAKLQKRKQMEAELSTRSGTQ